MLLQAAIGACLETLEYFCNGPLELSITLWMCNRCIANMDVEVFAVLLKYPASELGPVVSDDPIRDPRPADCLLILTTWVASDHFVNLSMMTYRYQNPPTTVRNGPGCPPPHNK
jgi:hypothetical protein